MFNIFFPYVSVCCAPATSTPLWIAFVFIHHQHEWRLPFLFCFSQIERSSVHAGANDAKMPSHTSTIYVSPSVGTLFVRRFYFWLHLLDLYQWDTSRTPATRGLCNEKHCRCTSLTSGGHLWSILVLICLPPIREPMHGRRYVCRLGRGILFFSPILRYPHLFAQSFCSRDVSCVGIPGGFFFDGNDNDCTSKISVSLMKEQIAMDRCRP